MLKEMYQSVQKRKSEVIVKKNAIFMSFYIEQINTIFFLISFHNILINLYILILNNTYLINSHYRIFRYSQIFDYIELYQVMQSIK